MLDPTTSHVPNKQRTHLVSATEDDAQRCDVFRVEYRTQDEQFHDFISTLTIRYMAHKIQGKNYVVIAVYETLDEKIRSFIDTYKDQRVIVTFREFDFDGGSTRHKKDYVCMFEGGCLPFMCDLPEKPATFELVFREV